MSALEPPKNWTNHLEIRSPHPPSGPPREVILGCRVGFLDFKLFQFQFQFNQGKLQRNWGENGQRRGKADSRERERWSSQWGLVDHLYLFIIIWTFNYYKLSQIHTKVPGLICNSENFCFPSHNMECHPSVVQPVRWMIWWPNHGTHLSIWLYCKCAHHQTAAHYVPIIRELYCLYFLLSNMTNLMLYWFSLGVGLWSR